MPTDEVEMSVGAGAGAGSGAPSHANMQAQSVVVTGCIYKVQKLKPNIIDQYSGEYDCTQSVPGLAGTALSLPTN